MRLELHVGSGTYVRAIAEALGGHCTALRRTAVGPFAVEEADPDGSMSVAERSADCRTRRSSGFGGAVAGVASRPRRAASWRSRRRRGGAA